MIEQEQIEKLAEMIDNSIFVGDSYRQVAEMALTMALHWNHDTKESAPEMYDALELTTKELEWAINEVNRLHKVNHDYRSLDEPEHVDMETCHNNSVILAKARGEL